eukprot:CAMPEP_0168609554 /NCGR_PEP_ID=MMETSP0449_2-20121227/1274_1 /TAXON_ID=1082188 /ORGANISM="Strombidium rassoulzadegani, Strain ras09" /LENGTH=96 /DNA_ID=CAMNT_0008649717 /DNA_START=828 /DNA_END=1118 /DNA_ORIENTATION=-
MHGLVHPPPRVDVVQPCDDDLELLVKICGHLLDHAGVVFDLGTGDSLHDELGGNFGLELVHILLSEEELAIEVGQVDLVHVDHGNILYSAHRQIFY